MHAHAVARSVRPPAPPLVLLQGNPTEPAELLEPGSIDFDEVARNHASALLSHAKRLTRERWEAWDLVQDTFERALTRPPKALEPPKMRCWLFVVIKTPSLVRGRAGARRRTVALTEDTLAYVPEEEVERLPRWRSIDVAEVRACLDKLDQRLREPYELQEQGLTLAAIAARLGVPPATVGTRIYRARRKLRKLLTPIAEASAGLGESAGRRVSRARRYRAA
jgi:RNA polymerase sigma-70 factor (ECF subfamily)